jgi:perosamine synthetase
MKNGQTVAAFERELASYCGSSWAIAASNGTVTLQAALVALGVKPGDRVAVPPLTHAATTIAVLNVGAVPEFVDVDSETWLMQSMGDMGQEYLAAAIPVSLYGLHWQGPYRYWTTIDDAAQTLRPHHRNTKFTSLSFQASKILSTGEGGALLTNDQELAARARSYLSLGYAMAPGQARIDPAILKSPTFDRHVMYPAINGRMNDVTAGRGLLMLAKADHLLHLRQEAAERYADEILEGEKCPWLTPQKVPEHSRRHDYWTYAVACDTPERALWLADAMERHGGERPYFAWRLTYHEPAFQHLACERSPEGYPVVRHEISFQLNDECTGTTVRLPAQNVCPVAESLQPRILQMQTNDLASAERNARALRLAIQEAA